MIMKKDAKFVKELTCHFKIDMMNLTNVDPSTRKSQKFLLNWAAFDKSLQYLSLESTKELCLMTLKIDTKFERKMTCASKNGMRNLASFNRST